MEVIPLRPPKKFTSQILLNGAIAFREANSLQESACNLLQGKARLKGIFPLPMLMEREKCSPGDLG